MAGEFNTQAKIKKRFYTPLMSFVDFLAHRKVIKGRNAPRLHSHFIIILSSDQRFIRPYTIDGFRG